MSQPKRYRLNPVLVWLPGADIVGIDNIREVTHASMECKEDESGMWVLHSDYAALAAEYERLRSSSFVTAVPSEEYERLKAENERLRKAGDDLAILQCAESDEQHKRRCLVAWLAAKEGGAK